MGMTWAQGWLKHYGNDPKHSWVNDLVRSGAITSKKQMQAAIKMAKVKPQIGGATSTSTSSIVAQPPPMVPNVMTHGTPPGVPLDESAFTPPTLNKQLDPNSTLLTKQAIVDAKSGPTIIASTPQSSGGSMDLTGYEPFPLDGDLTEGESPSIPPLVLIGAAVVLLLVMVR